MTNTEAAPIQTVGVIGAGRIGQPIIGHLAREGFTVVAHDVDAGKREAVVKLGATWAVSPREVARAGDAILVCVGYDRELRELIAEGLLEDVSRGALVAVLSTVNPRTVQMLAELARPLGVDVVDSTMCRAAGERTKAPSSRLWQATWTWWRA